ncbi:MAG: hypothetical protein P4M08_06045 [Oligoflexia bacterium]|nr:hypothetical protein [Oligoflexia bacterium]
MRACKIQDIACLSFLLAALFETPLSYATVGNTMRNAILARKTLHEQNNYGALNNGVSGQIIGYAMGNSRDRIQVHIRFDSGDGKTEDAWIHYRPDLSDRRQSLLIYDQDGRTTLDITRGKTFTTIKAGVSAWETMEHVQGEIQAFNAEAKPKGKSDTERKTASILTSTQPLVPGALWSTDCEDFIDSDGNYGKWGEALYNTLGQNGTEEILASKIGDMSVICPKYYDFDDVGRKNFWIWLAASVAMEESSCNPEIHTSGPNGTAAGLWQLDLGNRNPVQHERCGSISAYDGTVNIKCGLSMLNWYTEIDARNSRKIIYWHGNYWQTLHPGNPSQTRTNRLIRMYHACSK